MINKVLIPLYLDQVAPRFDLSTEALIVTHTLENQVEEERNVILPQASSEKLCHIILTEHIDTVICGAIEDEYHQFLKWKKIEIWDSVAGPVREVLARYLDRLLKPGQILWTRKIEGRHV